LSHIKVSREQFGSFELMSPLIDAFLAEHRPPTPCLVIDLAIVRRQYRALADAFPETKIYYAVKANPAREVIVALAALGANFDLASEGEIARCRELGVPAARCSFGNTIKRETDIAEAQRYGIDLFAFDCPAELDKLARAAPGARVFCRLGVHGGSAQWPLNRKFGCSTELATELLLHAPKLGLQPFGVSFHVGSQQLDPAAWEGPIAHAARVFRDCANHGVDLQVVNLGGGLPAHYDDPIAPLEQYGETIRRALRFHFGGSQPITIIEPGRYMVGDAGLLRSEILLVSRRGAHAHRRWVYVDAGRYNGLPETLDERIRYCIRTGHDGAGDEPAILAGPTCDSTDVLYQNPLFRLPRDIEAGEPLDFLSAGAYTASYAAVEFNGFSPMKTYCI
jgi:ornithine decarboxylase